MKQYFVYILASKRNGTLYAGITSDLVKRAWEHRNDLVDGFTNKYKVHRLVYYESYERPIEAIAREKQLKWWKRKWKVDLIENVNSEWKDLFEKLV